MSLRAHAWWAAHNLIVHPLMTMSGYAAWVQRLHDWTAARAEAAEAEVGR